MADGVMSVFNLMREQIRTNFSNRATNTEEWLAMAPDRDHVFLKSLDCWNGCDGRDIGSQNLPQVSAAACGYYEFLVDLAELELKTGLFARESGSLGFYFVGPLVSKMVALRAARHFGDARAVGILEDWFRAVWYRESLASVLTLHPLQNAWRRGSVGELQDQAVNGHEAYHGAALSASGMRINKNAADAKHSAAFGKDVYFSWACSISARKRYNNKIVERGELGPDHIVAELAKVDSYVLPTPASIWGLTEDERLTLRRIVSGDLVSAKRAIDFLNVYPGGVSYGPQEYRITRYTSGFEVALSHAVNGNKSGVQLTVCSVDSNVVSRDIYSAVALTNQSGANKGWKVSVTDEQYNLEGIVSYSVPRFREVKLWEIVMNSSGVTVLPSMLHNKIHDETVPPVIPIQSVTPFTSISEDGKRLNISFNLKDLRRFLDG